ncbi:MAG: hypothetical protein FWC98_03475, partial [Bacteroidales bacterium]|nr:hypothetical protein [Bacteroidales bacterium]
MKNLSTRLITALMLAAFAVLMIKPNSVQAQVVFPDGARIIWQFGDTTLTAEQMQNYVGSVMTIPLYITIPQGANFPNMVRFGASNIDVQIQDLQGNPMSRNAGSQPMVARHLPATGGGNNFINWHEPTANAGIITPAAFPASEIESEANYGGSLRQWHGAVSLHNSDGSGNSLPVRVFDWPVFIEEVGSFQICVNPHSLPFVCAGYPADLQGNCPGMYNLIFNLTTTGDVTLRNNTLIPLPGVGEGDFMFGTGGYNPEQFNQFVCGVITVLMGPEVGIDMGNMCPWESDTVTLWAQSPSGDFTNLVIEVSDVGSTTSWQVLTDVLAGGTISTPFGLGGVTWLEGPTTSGTRFDGQLLIDAGSINAFHGRNIRITGRTGTGANDVTDSVFHVNVAGATAFARQSIFLNDGTPSNNVEMGGTYIPGSFRRDYVVDIGHPVMLSRVSGGPSFGSPPVSYFQLTSAGTWGPVQNVPGPGGLNYGFSNAAMQFFTVSGPSTFIGFTTVEGCRVPTDTIVITSPMTMTLDT